MIINSKSILNNVGLSYNFLGVAVLMLRVLRRIGVSLLLGLLTEAFRLPLGNDTFSIPRFIKVLLALSPSVQVWLCVLKKVRLSLHLQRVKRNFGLRWEVYMVNLGVHVDKNLFWLFFLKACSSTIKFRWFSFIKIFQMLSFDWRSFLRMSCFVF